jgi:hypothetical protein
MEERNIENGKQNKIERYVKSIGQTLKIKKTMIPLNQNNVIWIQVSLPRYLDKY